MPQNSSRLPLRPTDLVLMAALQTGPSHGYALSQAILERSDRSIKVRPGDLYRVLYRLAEQGLIEAREPAGQSERRKTEYALTDHGRRVLISEARRLAELSSEILSHVENAP